MRQKSSIGNLPNVMGRFSPLAFSPIDSQTFRVELISPDVSKHKLDSLHDLSRAQFRLTLLARAYYFEIYSLFFCEDCKPPCDRTEFLKAVLIHEDCNFQTPGCMCAQILLRSLRFLRQNPAVFAKSLISAVSHLRVKLFAFSTFPACYSFFTRPEGVKSASELITELLAIDEGLSQELVRAVFQSFLFSAYLFIEALWAHFHRKVSTKQKIDEEAAIAGLCGAIEACRPLISAPLIVAIQAVLGRFPEVCCDAVIRWLEISFDLWYEHSAEGMSFGCGASFQEFLRNSEEFCVGNSITIVSALIGGKRRIPLYQGISASIDCLPEAIVFSSGDFELFQRAFKHTSDKISLFHTIGVPEGEPFATPYLLDYFSKEEIPFTYEIPVIASPQQPTIVPDVDPIYERAILQNVNLFGSKFEEYRSRKEILEANRRMEELEDLLRVRLELNITQDFQSSVLRLRNYGFMRYAATFLVSGMRRPARLEVHVNEILRDCPDKGTLIVPLVVAILNTAQIITSPKGAGPLFANIRRKFMGPGWEKMNGWKFRGLKRINELIPELTRRPLGRYGDAFMLFGHFFWGCRMITQYFKVDVNNFEWFIKFVTFVSEHGGLLNVYLFIERVFRRNPSLVPEIDRDKDWMHFGNVMSAALEEEPKLCTSVRQALNAQ
jgi:hypothetical protein